MVSRQPPGNAQQSRYTESRGSRENSRGIKRSLLTRRASTRVRDGTREREPLREKKSLFEDEGVKRVSRRKVECRSRCHGWSDMIVADEHRRQGLRRKSEFRGALKRYVAIIVAAVTAAAAPA